MSLAGSFTKTRFARLVNSPAGRIARVIAGLGLIGFGYTIRGRSAGIVLMVLGAVPLLAGIFDLCLVSALLGGSISGSRVRGGNRTS